MKKTNLLILYARAMQAAQNFELALKVVLILLMAYHDRARRHLLFTEAEFSNRLAKARRKTLGTTLEKVLYDYSVLDVPPLPDDFVSQLRLAVIIRNYLAHSYLPDNSLLVQSEDGRQFLAGELGWFSAKLEAPILVFEKLAEVVEKGLGGTWKKKSTG